MNEMAGLVFGFCRMEIFMSRYLDKSELWDMIKMHIYTSLAAFFLGVIMIFFTSHGIGKYIFSIVFMLVHMLVLYSKSEDIARHNKKEYTNQTAYWWKGILLPLGIFAIWGALFVLYKVTWQYDIISYNSGFINNFLFLFWNYIYSGFLGLSGGYMNIWALVFVFGAPLAASFLGYLAGFKGFDLSIKVAGIMYEKKDDN